MDDRLNGKNLPDSAGDVDSFALNVYLDEEFGFISQKMGEQAEQIQELIKTDVGGNVIKAAMAEFLETARMRLMLMSGQAMDALEEVMLDVKGDSKTATARVRAAEAILDRGGFPKATQQFRLNADLKETDQLMPSLGEVLEGVPPGKVSQVMEQYNKTVQMIDDLRAGGMVIDVTEEMDD